jgi:hypothetical protein
MLFTSGREVLRECVYSQAGFNARCYENNIGYHVHTPYLLNPVTKQLSELRCGEAAWLWIARAI